VDERVGYPGAKAASFSTVPAPGGTESSARRNRAAAKIAQTTHDGGMFRLRGQKSRNS
jgi:hypothetical protein